MVNEKKIDAIKKGKPVSWPDLIIFLVTAAVIVLLLVFSVYKDTGNYLCVSAAGEKKYYSLDTDRELSIDGHITVVIESKTVWIVYSDCPDHYCQKSGKIKYTGQRLVCAPNKIVLSIVKDNDDLGNIVTGRINLCG